MPEYDHRWLDRIEEQHQHIPSAVVDRQIILRGSEQWNDREYARKLAGCRCLSFGTLSDSIVTNGQSAREYPVA